MKRKSKKILLLSSLILIFIGVLYYKAYAAGIAHVTKTNGHMTLQYTDADGSFYEWDVIINFGNDLINHNVSDSGSRYPHEKISITANQKQGAKKDIKFDWMWLGYDIGDERVPGGYYRNLTIQFLIPRTTGADTLEAVGYSQSNYLHSFTDESTEQDIKDGYYRTGATFPLQDMGIGIIGIDYEVPPAHQITTNAVIHVKSVYNNYTVKFDGNGADGGSTNENKCTYQTAFDLNANGFYKNNYIFTGWNTKANGTGIAYTNKQNVINLTATKDGTITLYAQWFKNKYTLNFNADGGVLPTGGNIGLHGNLSTDRKTGNITVTYNDPSFSIMDNDCPSREGYSFNGWYRAYWKDDGLLDHLEQIYDSSGKAVESSLWGYWDNNWHYKYAGNETLWAGWTRNSYYLDLNATYNHSTNLGGLKDGGLDLGSCDVYVYDDNGNIWDKAIGVTDYYKQVPYNYTYEVKNFNKNAGYIFCDNGTLKGSIKAGNTEARIYVYDNYSLAYYDGNGATGGQYINGMLFLLKKDRQ